MKELSESVLVAVTLQEIFDSLFMELVKRKDEIKSQESN